jgi:hypothetical protein
MRSDFFYCEKIVAQIDIGKKVQSIVGWTFFGTGANCAHFPYCRCGVMSKVFVLTCKCANFSEK